MSTTTSTVRRSLLKILGLTAASWGLARQVQAQGTPAPEQLRIGYQKSAVNLVIIKQQGILEKRFPNTVWHTCGGVGSWYVNPSTKRVDAIWPASTVEYMYRTRSASPKDYHIED